MNAQTNEQADKKKTWQTPELVVYGDIEKITGEKNIGPGSS
jgi:hypothetical protein